MALFHPPTVENSSFVGKILSFRPTFPVSNHYSQHPLKQRSNRLNLLFRISLPNFPSLKSLRISSHFGRFSRRQNSLRKKLLDPQKVRKIPDFPNPETKFQNLDSTPDENNSSGSNHSNVNEIGLTDNVLSRKLDNWVEQYKKETEFWGIGSGPIFSIYLDSDEKISRVTVDEKEIIRRSQRKLGEEIKDVKFKISHAKEIAKKVSSGEYSFPKNSSIAKFVVEGEKSLLIDRFQAMNKLSYPSAKFPQIGFIVMCGCIVILGLRKMLRMGNDGEELSRLEKEMLRRKMKSRMEREKIKKGNVEVLEDISWKPASPLDRPQLNKDELMKHISKEELSRNEPIIDSSKDFSVKDSNVDDKILEIQVMAREVRENEQNIISQSINDAEGKSIYVVSERINGDEINKDALEATMDIITKSPGSRMNSELKSSTENMVNVESVETMSDKILRRVESMELSVNGSINQSLNNFSDEDSTRCQSELVEEKVPELEEKGVELPVYGTVDPSLVDIFENDAAECSSKIPSESDRKNDNLEIYNKRSRNDVEESIPTICLQEPNEMVQRTFETPYTRNEGMKGDSSSDKLQFKFSNKKKPRIIKSVKEARTYLSQKQGTTIDKGQFEQEMQGRNSFVGPDLAKVETQPDQKILGFSKFNDKVTGDSVNLPETLDSSINTSKKNESFPPTRNDSYTDFGTIEASNPQRGEENWIEKNFQVLEPLARKIGDGFRENYKIARDNVKEKPSSFELSDVALRTNIDEFEWMYDEKLKDIVFRVRDNELAGRDPFYLMNDEDQKAFFEGLEKKVEKENSKLLDLHEWIHSKIENLDYGADGISLYDPPEKIIPRWKGSPIERDPDFLKNSFGSQDSMSPQKIVQGLGEQTSSEDTSISPHVQDPNSTYKDGGLRKPKTIIEGSDGSVKIGQKSGKEYWQHTKKWSREFLESYNAETDPEVKSIMKDMGKDLDKWITEKEIKEVGELMDRIPLKRRKNIENKLDKFKREMEMFGPQAVLSKYREYSDQKEEDYLWWLDLQFVLCIELYRNQNGVQEVGFYSLEMAGDLELNPKQQHVIAFEDPGDAKNFCYIIQAHMDMLGDGSAFLIARPPKDAFREAKANGFNVTVIRRGEIKINVDQTLEEVEEEIIEKGSKMYHDKIMQERSVDMGALMKGVFGTKGSSKRKKSKNITKKRRQSK